MAASDKFYRDQKALHVVFAASSVVLLVSTVWMFWDDFNRPYKTDQVAFRKVEEELAKRAMLANAPTDDQRKDILAAEKAVADARKTLVAVKDKVRAELRPEQTAKVKVDTKYQGIKADYDSRMSYFNIAVDEAKDGLNSPEAKRLKAEVEKLQGELAEAKKAQDEAQAKFDAAETTPKEVAGPDGKPVSVSQRDAEKQLSAAEKKHKALTEGFDRFQRAAVLKEWTIGDTIRGLPILEGFASPTKIVQTAHDDLPIDYGGFKYVTRFDRCTTCHQGMEKGTYTKEAIAALSSVTPQEMQKHNDAVAALVNRKRAAAGQDTLTTQQVVDGGYLTKGEYARLAPKAVDLTLSRVSMFAAHPRLDLYVDANSPHSAEKFGCTSCHGGQGTATTFSESAHSPNDAPQEKAWEKEHGYVEQHHWDFPMHPARFSESGCVKCHHQIEGLTRDGNEHTAPKLDQGYNLVRELGCFGCHEISGLKAGRWVGPDLRLEPEVPVESLSAVERQKASDPANPPGAMRKVGPSLSRIAEKTHEAWTAKWLKAPRDFRPDTKMPHFYLQSTNTPEALSGTGQEKFPDAEIQAITHYLFRSSEQHLAQAMSLHTLKTQAKLTDDEQKQLARMKASETYGAFDAPVSTLDLPPMPTDEKGKGEQMDAGRHLFATKGCMACHQHETMLTDGKPAGEKPLPSLAAESNFGPNLSRLAAKLGKAGDPASGRKWLVQWLLNPMVHSPRTKMPSVHLTTEEANSVAVWLLNQPTDWSGLAVDAANTDTLKALARTYLKSLPAAQVEDVLKNGIKDGTYKDRPEADEKYLEGEITDGKLKMFVGKKAINNLGCYACHSIPGFQNAKPIGAALNDWGKKDPSRIAFEDGAKFVTEHFTEAETREDEKAKGKPAHEWAEAAAKQGKDGQVNTPNHRGAGKKYGPYEQYFLDALQHHKREGFLHLKLAEPRSYDYNRIKEWTDRTRMPQFKFSRVKRTEGESDADFLARETKAEAEGREAVMTFILGLIAEPIPTKFVYTPTGDRAAEVRGRQVIEKYNCASCHYIRPGIYDFNLSTQALRDLEGKLQMVEMTDADGKPMMGKDGKPMMEPMTAKRAVMDKMTAAHVEIAKQEKDDPKDRPYPDHNAWTPPDVQKGERLRARGMMAVVKDENSDDVPGLRLTNALSFTDAVGTVRTIPANTDFPIFVDPRTVKTTAQPLGGQFALLLKQYLSKRDSKEYGEPTNVGRVNDVGGGAPAGYAAIPPSLQHEGERVQSIWLYDFLLNPKPIRKLTVLQMPKFSLSDEEAMALVNYFPAVNRLANPATGLTYPYSKVEQRDETYLKAETKKYVARLKEAGQYDARVAELKPVWEAAAKADLDAARKRVEAAKDDADRAAKLQKDVDRLDAYIKAGTFDEQRKEWEEREAYVSDAYRLTVNVAAGSQCLSCHQVGHQLPNDYRAPNLNHAWERLRPEWTERWLAYPQRLNVYASLMQPLFKPSEAEKFKTTGVFVGSADEQIKATRDVLILWPQIAELPSIKNRALPTAAPAGGK